MNRVCKAVVACGIAVALAGCGKDDPNKNLKPIDPNMKPPKMVTDGGGGGEKPASVLK